MAVALSSTLSVTKDSTYIGSGFVTYFSLPALYTVCSKMRIISSCQPVFPQSYETKLRLMYSISTKNRSQLHSCDPVFETSISTGDLQTLRDVSDDIIRRRKYCLQAPEL